MTQGEGLMAFLYAIKGIFEAGIMWVLTGIAVLIFFYVIVGFVAKKMNWNVPTFGMDKNFDNKRIINTLVILFIIFAIYPLIGLIAAIFGVNSSPVGGLLVQ